jgi:hypothetical protein
VSSRASYMEPSFRRSEIPDCCINVRLTKQLTSRQRHFWFILG